MSKKLALIIFPVHFSNEKIEKFELNIFKNKGFEIRVHDITDIIYSIQRPKAKSNNTTIKKFSKIKDWEDELYKIKSKKYSEIIILNFLLQYTNFKDYILFKKLTILDAKNIGFLNAGTYNPNYSSALISFKHIRKFIHHLKLNINYLKTFIELKKIGFKFYAILAGSLSEKRNFHLSSFYLKIKIIDGHCWDISNIHYLSQQDNSIEKGYGVLLDGAGPKFKNDENYLNTKSILTAKRWYPRLCLLFDFLESSFKTNIIIKAHYSSIHPNNPDYFGNRKVFHHSLINLIKNSSFVITRMSTSLIIALFYNKPVIIITSDEHLTSPSGKLYQGNISQYLSCSYINLDNSHTFNKIKLNKIKESIRIKFLRNFGSLSNFNICNASIIINDLNKKNIN